MQTVPLKAKKSPLFLEVPVSQELGGPFLVTSSRDFLWVNEGANRPVVRTAVRSVGREELYRGLVERVCKESQEREWGSVHPNTREGLRGAVKHLLEYELTDLVVLYEESFDTEHLDLDIPAEPVDWLPEGWAVVVPSERGFLGTMFDLGEGRYAAVLHNASRALGILVPA